jgi:hypothetical protein
LPFGIAATLARSIASSGLSFRMVGTAWPNKCLMVVIQLRRAAGVLQRFSMIVRILGVVNALTATVPYFSQNLSMIRRRVSRVSSANLSFQPGLVA